MPTFHGTLLGTRRLLATARNIVTFNILNYFSDWLGQILVGRVHGAHDLGLLSRAQQIFQMPLSFIFGPLGQILLPLLSKMHSSERFKEHYLLVLQLNTLLFFTAAAVLPIVAGEIVRLLLGSSWAPAAEPLAWFSAALAAQGIALPATVALTSQGRTGELRNWGVYDFLIRAGGVIGGLPYGIVGVAAGLSLAMLLVGSPIIIWVLSRQGPVGKSDQIKVILSSAVVAFGVGAAVAGTTCLLELWNLSLVTHLLTIALTAVTIAAGIAFLMKSTRSAMILAFALIRGSG
jgi:PST family polysaccharide transporter